MNGYRKMISDNVPLTWDNALRWCKCRTRWIEYIYTTHVKKYDKDYRSKAERKRLKSKAVKEFCGRSKNDFGHYTSFDCTINTDRMLLNDKESFDYWIKIIRWVKWFQQNSLRIKESIETYRMQRLDNDEIFRQLSISYNLNSKLAKYMLDCYDTRKL